MRQKWTKDENELLAEWIKDNPKIYVRGDVPTQGLNELFPHRSTQSVYHRWRVMRKLLKLTPIVSNTPKTAHKHGMWTDADTHTINKWIKDNLNVKITWRTIGSPLHSLLPHKDPSAIYHKWRRCRKLLGLSPVPHKNGTSVDIQPKPHPKFNLFAVISEAVNIFIDSEANRLAAEKTVAIQTELTELKTLMQKFTKARQAIMDVRL